MRGRPARVAIALLIAGGLIVHIGLGYRFGLLVAGIGLLGHLGLGVVARKLSRRGGPRIET